MRTCSSKKISYSSYHAALTALKEVHVKAGYRIQEGPQNIYRCEICDQYHLTSKGAAHPELKSGSGNFSERTQNEISRWKDKFKDY